MCFGNISNGLVECVSVIFSGMCFERTSGMCFGNISNGLVECVSVIFGTD